MGATADILAVCVPGRGRRGDERAPASIAELAEGAAAAVAAAADRPTYLFGHSLGAVVAFEVARRLRGASTLRHLVASGCAAPALLPTDYLRWADQLDGRAFAEAMVRFEGMSPEIANDPDLQELLLPDLRADCRLIAEYHYQPAAPLSLRLSLVNGRDDWHISNDMLEPWRTEVTTAPDYHWRDGGHFYFADRPDTVLGVLRALVERSEERLRGVERSEERTERGAGQRGSAGEPAPSDEHVEVI
jgi:surfactin synthase thioesterase subunit